MRKFREGDVGGRLVYSFTGSSPTAPEVIAFLRDALLVPVYEGYGSTEAGMVRARGRPARKPGRPARPPGRAPRRGRLHSGRLFCMRSDSCMMQQTVLRGCAESNGPCHCAPFDECKEAASGQIGQGASHAGSVLLCTEASLSIELCSRPTWREPCAYLAAAARRADQHGLGDEQH